MDVLLNWIWQGGVVVLVAALLIRSHSLSAAARYRLWWATLWLVVALPFVAIGESVGPSAAEPGAVVSLPEFPIEALAIGAFAILWVALRSLKLAVAIVAVSRAKRAAVSFPVDRERRLRHWSARNCRARLVVSDRVRHAAVLGWHSPVIAVTPVVLEELDDAELDQVVLHEWAHIERRDDLAVLAQQVLNIAIGWHPALWWINRQLHNEREAACDDLVVDQTGSGKVYAACLTKLAMMPRRSAVALLAPAALSAPRLRTRVLRLIGARRPIPATRRTIVGGATATVLLGVFLLSGTFRAVGKETPFGAMTSRADTDLVVRTAAVEHVAAARVASGTQVSRIRRDRAARSPDVPNMRSEPAMMGQTNVVAPISLSEPTPPIMPSAPPGYETASASLADTERVEPPRMKENSPWSAAADAGVAVGRSSQKAAVRTAGFFSRLGKRIAGSF